METEEYIIAMREYFHENPELSFKEFKTADRLEKELRDMGLNPKRITETGIIADIKGKGKKTVAIRADIDALPVTEENKVDYVSKNKGVMHACGHDTHMAMLLGAAKMLIAEKEKLNGNIRLIFQPAEELPPGGAVGMIKNGALDGVDYIIGQHIMGFIPAGKIAIYYKEMMANADEFDIKIHGKGGHGSAPQDSIDAVYITAHLIEMLNTIVSREIDPQEPAVITTGTVNSGYRYNIIAAHAELTGTVRTFNIEVQEKIIKRIKDILEGLKSIYGIEYEYEYKKGYPVLVNNEKIAKYIEEAAKRVVGKDNIIYPKPNMGGEDFAYFLQKVPGSYYFIGGSNPERGIDSMNHSPTFDVDESALYTGAKVLKEAAMEILNKE
ncbi:M20 metallopeptidase family protein [Ferroplasma acidiphilum]|jgi:amidohydrolase|uniref:M20 metallopeptidase family protein n=1 Tax=Ferroplasma acidiphilum TaxID=74969 RepID=UPI0023F04C0F|nr:amidohydrolase [Ferroplasma acidiphilum]WMT52630.1 MAG: amidohydrolase [Ferroplasma acidiphilum]